jgi:hypothetical protein
MRVCGHTGLITSIGADGRLVYSLNGRVVSHKQKEDFSFNMSRTHMQLVRHRSEPLEDGFNEALITHDDCVDGMWLELRLGDGALIDHQPVIFVGTHFVYMNLCIYRSIKPKERFPK